MTELTQEKRYSDASEEVLAWERVAKDAQWTKLLDVQAAYPKAEAVQVGKDSYTVFNLRHNRFRLVVKIVYPKVIFIKDLMTHAEYDRDLWKASLLNEQKRRLHS